MEQRVAWDDLPGPLKQAIEAHTGSIESVSVASAGQNSPLAAVIDARDGKVFAKGLPSTHRRVLLLMASGGHTAHEAERQASRLPAFQASDPAHIDLFAAANVRLWDEIAQASTSDWTTKMAQAAKSWAAYRQVL